MYRRNQILIENRGIHENINCQSQAILNDVQAARNFIIEHNGLLPEFPPFEEHPYLENFPLQSFSKYIIGTFPPINYLIDLINNFNIPQLINPANGGNLTPPSTPFYHGNVDDLWRLFLTEDEFVFFDELPREQRKNHLIDKLINLKINYSDIMSTAQRSQYNANDNGLNNICPNMKLIEHILINPNAKYLMFDTSKVFNTALNSLFNANGIIGENEVKSYELFLKVLQDFGFKIEVDFCSQDANTPNGRQTFNVLTANIFQQNYRKKVYSKLEITLTKHIQINESNFYEGFNKEFVIITSASPSPQAAIQLGLNPIYQNWLVEFANAINPTIQFRRYIYQLFRNDNWDTLHAMNI